MPIRQAQFGGPGEKLKSFLIIRGHFHRSVRRAALVRVRYRLERALGAKGVIGPVVLLALALVLLAAAGLRSAALKSDQLSIDRQTREAQLALATTQDDLAQSQTGLAIWNLALIELRRQPRPDWLWFDNNVGGYLNSSFAHNADFILDGHDRPIWGMVSGKRVHARNFLRIAPALSPMIDAVRGRSRRLPNPHERLPTGVAKNATVRTPTNATHATDLVKLGNRPAAVSVMRMIPDSKALKDTPGTEPLLVSIRYLDAGFTGDLAHTKLIDGARISARPDMARIERRIPLLSSGGQLLGYLIWKPELPGSQLAASLAPVAGLAVFLLVVVLVLLAIRLATVMRRMTRAHALLGDAHRELQSKEADAQHSAAHDSLTGLPNRAGFNHALEDLLNVRQKDEPLFVLLLDLDRFKQVNDTLGHCAGDELLQQVAGRVTERVDGKDLVARLGGDEFALLLRSTRSMAQTADIATRICAALRKPFVVEQCTVHIHASVGIVDCAAAPGGRSEVMRRADLAMYAAKKDGRGTYHFFASCLEDDAMLRREIETDLRHALQIPGQLSVIYQPRIDATNASLVGFEALVRWAHPEKGAIPPTSFIPVAEETGLIGPLGAWVLDQTCRVAAQWPDRSFAVNLSPRQIRDRQSAADIIAQVSRLGVAPGQIEFEITEGVLLQDNGHSREALAALRDAGFTISLDDFGTGFSSLNYLTRFEVDKIKIDRSFISRLDRFPGAPAIICAVVSLGTALGLKVCAEGVETTQHADFLRAAGCHELQGFLFSRGCRAEEIEDIIGRDWPRASFPGHTDEDAFARVVN